MARDPRLGRRFPGRALAEEEQAASRMSAPSHFRGVAPAPARPMRALRVGQIMLRAGDVLDLGEKDYKFGVGRLVLTVEAIYATLYHADGGWLTVSGSQKTWRDERTPRTVQVRVAAIPDALRPPPGQHRPPQE